MTDVRKFERVYRDCIKKTRDKTVIHCIPHDAPGQETRLHDAPGA